MEQTYKDLQILVIDDGSKDGTLEIIKSLAKEDSRIEYYHKENGGIGSAYIYAFGKVKGDYCLFVDSDDYVEKTLVNDVNLTIRQTNADVVQFGLKMFDEDGNSLSSIHFPAKELCGIENILKDYFYGLTEGRNFPGLSIRAIRSSFFNDFDYYSSSLSIDEILAAHILARANKIVFLDREYYCLIAYTTSVSRAKVTTKKVIGQFEGLALIPNIVKDFNLEIQTLVVIKLLSYAANFYEYYAEGYGNKTARKKMQELYVFYRKNRRHVKISLKTKITIWFLRYFPFINIIKNKISR